MNLTKTQLIIVAAVSAVVLIFALIFLGIIPGLRDGGDGVQVSGELTLWGVFDSPTLMNEVIAAYQQLRPQVQIRYRQLNPETYEGELINALAAGRGPDVLMFHNTWLPKHFNKLRPISEELFPVSRFRSLFPTVAEQDFAPNGVIYAMPLYIDTLAMFYNKDAFDTANIPIPPKTWSDFQDIIPSLRTLDTRGLITRAAAAIGGSETTINRATDILNLLMLQTGTEMVDPDFTRATFSTGGVEALTFYTQFANPASSLYTWSDSQPYSIDSFAEGRTAIMFNYSHQIATLKQKNPFLEFAIAAMPQPGAAQSDINYANYWGLAVSAQSRNPLAGWDFVTWLTANADGARTYLELTNRPPALRSLINQYGTHPELGVFARQALTARSWPQVDNRAVEQTFNEMIQEVISGRQTVRRTLQEAEAEITALMQ